MLISIDMGILTTVKNWCEEIVLWIRSNKARFLVALSLSLVGIILGAILFTNSNGNWWYCNRYDYATMLVRGNFFAVFFSLLLQTLGVCLMLYLSCAIKYLIFCKYLLLFVGNIYCGANLSCLFSLVGLFGIFYLLLFSLIEMATLLSLFYGDCVHTEYFKSLRETWCDCKGRIYIITALTCVKILLLFLILRPLSVSI